MPKRSVAIRATREAQLRGAARRDAPLSSSRKPLPGLAGPPQLMALQRFAGNRAVMDWLNGAGGGPQIQRQPEARVTPPRTERWEDDVVYRGRAAMSRTTSVEATAWAEVGPGPPRIRYRRTVELQTLEGVTFYLDIRGTVDLAPGTALPTSVEAALQTRGLRVLSQRSVHVEGGDVVEHREYSPHELTGQSFGFVANAVMPDYAKLPLTVQQQEAAILAYLSRLERRPKPPAASSGGPGAIGTIADIGTDFLPVVGELKDLYRAIYGIDPVTGEKLKWWEQALAALGAIPLLGKLSKGIRAGVKWLGRGLSWLKGRGALLAAWFAEKVEKWLRSRKAKRLEKEAKQLSKGGTASRAGRILLTEGNPIIAILDNNGRIVAKKSAATMSHPELVRRTLKGAPLPDDWRAVTIGKEGKEIYVLDSMNVHGRQLPPPQHFIDAVREQVE